MEIIDSYNSTKSIIEDGDEDASIYEIYKQEIENYKDNLEFDDNTQNISTTGNKIKTLVTPAVINKI